MSNIPSKKEYDEAKEIVSAYENEQKRLFDIKMDKIKKELSEYFDNNLLDGYMKVESFKLSRNSYGIGYDIITTPAFEYMYGGDNDKDIKKITEKYGMKNISFPYWMYPK